MHEFLERRDVRFTLIYGLATTVLFVCLHLFLNPFVEGKSIGYLLIGMVTGVGFIIITSAALFTLLRRETDKRKSLEQRLSEIPKHKRLDAVVEARYQLMVEVASEGIQFIGADARITYINPQMTVLHGFQPEEVIGHEYFDYIHPAFQESARKRFEERKVGVRGKRDVQILHKNGHYIWVHVSAAPVFGSDGTFEGTLTMYTDVTEAKKHEQWLEKALAREKELSDLKARLVTMASHEFRTPLAIIMSASELLLNYRDKMGKQKVDERLNTVKEQVVQLTSIIQEVLDVGQMQSKYQKFNPETIDLDALCREVINEFQNHDHPTHKLHYVSKCAPLMIQLDRDSMHKAISNLISNAIKYSPSSQDVFIGLETLANSAVLSVRDEGIGIPAEDISYLFDNFHRGTNVGTISGVGLGLAIAKQIVEMHGGSISVESQVDVGSTFTVSIPITSSE
jgi:PAS domain S-box-containing protein